MNNINIFPGQLGKQIERTFSRNCNSLCDVLKVIVLSYSVLVNILLFRQCLSLIISFESSIMCVRLSAEGIHRLYELQHLMMPLNAAVQ